ncbi:MAG: LTA synthase family protein [Lachnospiraceae bacterium]|nr:LTA synthase family protein [Lachnospiraceae bacterium]
MNKQRSADESHDTGKQRSADESHGMNKQRSADESHGMNKQRSADESHGIDKQRSADESPDRKNISIRKINMQKRNTAKPAKPKNKFLTGFGHLIVYLLLFLALLIFFSVQWAIANYGNIGMDEIVFTLSMSLEGTSPVFIFSYVKSALAPAVIYIALIFLIFHISDHYRYRLVVRTPRKTRTVQLFPLRFHAGFWFTGALAGFIAIVIIANNAFSLVSFIRGQFETSTFIEEVYVDPNSVDLEFPEEKRNLIWIYMESAESSTQDTASGGLFDTNYIPEMTELAKTNISFSQSDLIEGASVAPACGWTIAGLVAQTAGIPLKLFSYSSDNTMGNYEYFLPGATTLGDILEANGYTNYFMCGSDFDFAGRRIYFTQHGDYDIYDYDRAVEDGKISSDYYVWWGFEDAKLYDFAKEKLLEIAEEDEPFNFTMLTVDTHHPDGYVCSLCGDTYDEQYSNVWACASSQVYEFVSWIQEQDFYENTTIIITGDHCSMDTDYYGEYTYNKHTGETVRKVYNAFINVDPSVEDTDAEKNRQFTTLDFFPTALASLGVTIEGDRLALGTNLFSGTQTLSEEYGYEYLYEELNKKSIFYNQTLLYPSKENVSE